MAPAMRVFARPGRWRGRTLLQRWADLPTYRGRSCRQPQCQSRIDNDKPVAAWATHAANPDRTADMAKPRHAADRKSNNAASLSNFDQLTRGRQYRIIGHLG